MLVAVQHEKEQRQSKPPYIFSLAGVPHAELTTKVVIVPHQPSVLSHAPKAGHRVLRGCFGLQCEEEWRQSNPPCICGFAMDRLAADAALHYQPVGAFLVRMCSEPGSFAISCRTSSETQHPNGGASYSGSIQPLSLKKNATSILRCNNVAVMVLVQKVYCISTLRHLLSHLF